MGNCCSSETGMQDQPNEFKQKGVKMLGDSQPVPAELKTVDLQFFQLTADQILWIDKKVRPALQDATSLHSLSDIEKKDGYHGHLTNGKKTGFGQLLNSDKDLIIAEFQDGEPVGKGQILLHTGDYMVGEFSKGHIAKGELFTHKGDRYQGDFKDNKPHGIGQYSFANGRNYQGGFFAGERYGTGKYNWPDGSWHEGEWRYGKQHGKGKFVEKDGKCYNGLFEEGRFVKGQTIHPDPNA